MSGNFTGSGPEPSDGTPATRPATCTQDNHDDWRALLRSEHQRLNREVDREQNRATHRFFKGRPDSDVTLENVEAFQRATRPRITELVSQRRALRAKRAEIRAALRNLRPDQRAEIRACAFAATRSHTTPHGVSRTVSRGRCDARPAARRTPKSAAKSSSSSDDSGSSPGDPASPAVANGRHLWAKHPAGLPRVIAAFRLNFLCPEQDDDGIRATCPLCDRRTVLIGDSSEMALIHCECACESEDVESAIGLGLYDLCKRFVLGGVMA